MISLPFRGIPAGGAWARSAPRPTSQPGRRAGTVGRPSRTCACAGGDRSGPGHRPRRLAARVVLGLSGCWIGAASAASVTEPGELIGVELGTPLKPGTYLFDTADYGAQARLERGARTGVDIPILIWSTPWKVLDGRLELYASQPALFDVAAAGGRSQGGVYNTLAGGGLAWKLGPHVGFLYLFGLYTPSDTRIAFASGSVRQDFALSYGDDDWSATAHLVYGTMFAGTARFGAFGPVQRNADALNLELSALRKLGALEVGPVALANTDLSVSNAYLRAGYVRAGSIAVGGLAGYDFGAFSLQAYLTRGVARRDPGGPDTRGWLRVVIPLDDDARAAGKALPSRVVER